MATSEAVLVTSCSTVGLVSLFPTGGGEGSGFRAG
jgi:hypothetical protein